MPSFNLRLWVILCTVAVWQHAVHTSSVVASHMNLYEARLHHRCHEPTKWPISHQLDSSSEALRPTPHRSLFRSARSSHTVDSKRRRRRAASITARSSSFNHQLFLKTLLIVSQIPRLLWKCHLLDSIAAKLNRWCAVWSPTWAKEMHMYTHALTERN